MSAFAHGPMDFSKANGKTLELNERALPLGDGHISTQPRKGYVFSCGTPSGGGGAHVLGNWIDGLTWDATRKVFVQGDVAWGQAQFAVASTGAQRTLRGNGLPLNHSTGTYPIQRNDPAFQWDRNPNAITNQSLTFSVPQAPTVAAQASCVSMGIIGVMLNGVPFFNALDAEGRDAVAHEVQDRCGGHPELRGAYHYHGPSNCIPGAQDNAALVGYALDGFGIYSMFDRSGKELSNADLDECHGRTGRVLWDGKEVEMYHYVLTREYPYTVGCFRGSPASARAGVGVPPMMGSPPAPGGARGAPPAEALRACEGKGAESACQFATPRGDTLRGTCREVLGGTACVPQRP
jgi:hypothetical protein